MPKIRPRAVVAVATVALLWLATTATAQPATAVSPSSKIAGAVLDGTAGGKSVSFLVVMAAKADLAAAEHLTTRAEKGVFVYDALRAHAESTQASVRGVLDGLAVDYRPHFLVNALQVVGDRALVETLAARRDVARIEANPWVRSSILPEVEAQPAPDSAPDTVEWNIRRVGADRAWAAGFTGQGVVIGNIDTGQQWNHPALQPQYRGWDGQAADHNYDWYDATDPGNRVPVDPYGHGTHTAGTMVGDDGGTNQIGVAPDAEWIGCRSMDSAGFGSPDTYITCFEFMLAPWDLDGQNPDPALAPAAVSNSWYCSISLEGCSQTVLREVVRNVRAAGIVPVVAAGNSGPSCETIGIDGPPAQYDDSYSVGATTMANALASFSSRGPATVRGETLIKPDIVAPGEGVRSSYPNNTYAVLSGTSMATPHIAGAVAVIYSAIPALEGDVSATEDLINSSARHINSSACQSDGSFPNNLFGWGLLNVAKAIHG